ncbi:conjugal transfer protein TraF, partial [Burkholderia gladioli]|uniref:conjugal transfer protein TraF n=1 Tax=Burkholderia gladioli TaxID=28095 RepID=UPI001640F5A7
MTRLHYVGLAVVSTIAAMTIMSSAADAAGGDYPSAWQCDGQAKFNWYCDDEKPAAPAAASAPKLEDTDDFDKIKSADEMREMLKHRLDVATMDPSPEHLRAYMKLSMYIQQKSATFADIWQRQRWQNPSLDYSLKRPTNNVAVHTYDQVRDSDQ